MSLPVLHLTARGIGFVVLEKDYDHWIGYVIQKIEEETGFPVEVEAFGYDRGEGDFSISGDDDNGTFFEKAAAIKKAIPRLWEAFEAEAAQVAAVKDARAEGENP